MAKNCKPIYNLPSISFVGAGDIGSNKIHFLVCTQYGHVVDQIGGIPELANGMSETAPFFTNKNLREAVKILSAASKMFQEYNILPEHVDCVGTAALRDAQKAIMAIIAEGDKKKIAAALEQLKELRQAFFPYSFRIISEKEEGELVAQAAINDLYDYATPEFKALTQRYPVITIAHCGGRSTEIIDLARGGKIEKKAVLHFGVHTHKKVDAEYKGFLHPDTQLQDEELREKWQVQKKSDYEARLLAASGGMYRSELKLVRKLLEYEKGTCVFPAQQTREVLGFLSRQNMDYFRDNCIDEKRIPHMAAGARSLHHLMQYIDADEIIFLNGKMVSVLAKQVCAKHFTQQEEPSSQQRASLLVP